MAVPWHVMASALELPLIVPAVRLDREAEAEAALALGRASQPWCAGFLIFGGEADEVRALTTRLRDAAERPIFIASDMERGAGQQVEGLRILPQAGIWGAAATPEECEAFGEITARDARSVGIDLLFAPVLDVRSEPSNPIVGNRAFGWDPGRVVTMGQAFVRGAFRGGAMTCAKHYPGHGPTLEDSHDALPMVSEPEHRLRRRDVMPFLEVLHTGGCPAVMTAHVHYPTLDPHSRIATVSRRILRPLFQPPGDAEAPVIFTDALIMAGALVTGTELDAGLRALAAGCDALLYPEHPEKMAAEFFAEGPPLPAETAGVLGVPSKKTLRQRAERSAERLRGFAERAEALEPEGEAPPSLAEVPLIVARRAVALAGGAALRAETSRVLVLDDDGLPGRTAVLRERAKAAGVAIDVVCVPDDDPLPDAEALNGSCTVVTLAQVRAWKGAAGISPRTDGLQLDLVQIARDRGCDLQWVSCTPLPGWSGVHIPGTGPAVEEAIAELLFPGA